ncbi:unnamed protein product, partial [Meganyctiphanes norvegica]
MLTTFALLLAAMLQLARAQVPGDSSYFPDWGTVIGSRATEPTCVDIPEDMGLCSGIDYTKMRLPNLLDHETLTEAQKQANYWVPLLNLRCHPDTQLFLCSLFTPVCLEQPIYPCRSLCITVRNGCEARMRQYSFPWPDMLHCDKFPEDNDMCIAPQSGGGAMVAPAGSHDVASCNALCDPVDTLENILDQYCRADVVVKTRLKRQRKGALLGRKAKVYKAVGAGEQGRRSLRRSPRFSLASSCCSIAVGSSTKFLIMGSTHGQAVQTTFIMPFGKSRAMKKALRMFKSLNCSDPTLFTGKGDAHLSKEPGGGVIKPEITEDGKRKRKNKEKGPKDKKKRGKKKEHDVTDENQKTEKNPDSKRRGRKKSKKNDEKQIGESQVSGQVGENIPIEGNFEAGNSGIDMKIVEKMVEMGGVKLNKKHENRKINGDKRRKGSKKERKGRKRKEERNRRRKEKEASMQIDLSEPDDLSVNNFDTVIEPSTH